MVPLYPPLSPRLPLYATFVDNQGVTICNVYHCGHVELKPTMITDRETLFDFMAWLDACWTLLGLARDDMTSVPVEGPDV